MNVSLEALWIRARTYVFLALPIIGIALVLYGAYDLFVGPVVTLRNPQLVEPINSTLPSLGYLGSFVAILLGVALAAFTTRKR